MKKLVASYDPEAKKMKIDFEHEFIRTYYHLLEAGVKKRVARGMLPGDFEVSKTKENMVMFSFDLEEPKGLSGILPENIASPIVDIVKEFLNSSLKEEFGTTEFIPLSGYPLKDLQKDIIEAIRNKRSFCLIDKYSEYLKFSRGETMTLKQCKVDYLSSDYSDVALYIYEGNLKKLNECFKGKLQEKEWD